MRFIEKHWQTPNTYCELFAPLPKKPGVYLLVSVAVLVDRTKMRVLYAGMSKNLSLRLNHQHEILKLLRDKFNYIRIYFKSCHPDSLRNVERDLIKGFNPPYNIVHRRRG